MTLIHHTRKILSIAAISFATLGLAPSASAQDEPPARVARVGYAYGNINFADAGSNEWVPLLANRPISTGDSVFVPGNGRAELQVGANALRLVEQTRISFINLNDDNIQIKLSQGSMVLRVRALQEKENVEVSTPNLNFSIQEPGEYRINVNDDNTSTVIVRSGIGVAQGDRDVITLRAGEQTRFSGTNLNHTQIARVPPFDTFDQWQRIVIALRKIRYQHATSLVKWSAISNSMTTAIGKPILNMVLFGIHAVSLQVGHRIATVNGFG